MKDQSDSNRKSERGQSLVEFAFSLVILLVLVSGVFDGARALFTYLSMRDAAQEGALYASVYPANTNGIIERTCAASNMVADMCSSDANLSDSNGFGVSVEYLPSGQKCMTTNTGDPANAVRVTVRHRAFPLTMPFIGVFVGGNSVEITASILDTIITPTCE
jgi:Flp pilus assembly protein TadG